MTPGPSIAEVNVPAAGALGEGVIATVHFDGCTLACAGCWNKHLWPHKACDESLGSVAKAVAAKLACTRLDGIVWSGGEPLQYPHFPAFCQQVLIELNRPKVWTFLYTGYAGCELPRIRFSDSVLRMCGVDGLCGGRYNPEKVEGARWPATSTNQEVVWLTDRARGKLRKTSVTRITAATTTQLGADGPLTEVL
jgi:anaerobic ribonucleoside-triphosphate reductase activating protein